MSSKAKQAISKYPTVRTSNRGRRYVEVHDLLRSEASRTEIKKQAAITYSESRAQQTEGSADISVDPNHDQGETEVYTVKVGDSMWSIADNKLGDGNRYMEIFYANRDKMDSPQSVLHPGDKLKIPQDNPLPRQRSVSSVKEHG